MKAHKRMPRVQGKYFCWTLNNYTDEELSQLHAFGSGLPQDSVTYLCWGPEVGESGTPHLQGYMEFKKRKGLRAVKRIPGMARSHIEKRAGTQDEARDYTQKECEEKDFVEYGVLVSDQSGKRTDLEEIRDKIKSGTSELEIADDYFGKWCVYRKSFNAYRDLLAPPIMRRGLRVYVLRGAAGVGKSAYVHQRYPDLFTLPDVSLKWFDGYRNQSVVLIDDYRGQADASTLLRVLDIYPLSMPVKGGFVPFNPTTIFITSNLSSDEWHAQENNFGPALRRRIHFEVAIQDPLAIGQPHPELDECMPEGTVHVGERE